MSADVTIIIQPHNGLIDSGELITAIQQALHDATVAGHGDLLAALPHAVKVGAFRVDIAALRSAQP